MKRSIWTGPCCVDRIADAIEEALDVKVIRGTERVYFEDSCIDAAESTYTLRKALKEAHGTTFGL